MNNLLYKIDILNRPDLDRYLLVVNINGRYNDALVVILDNIPGIEIVHQASKYSLHLVVGKMFNSVDTVTRVKKTIEEFYTEEINT